MSTDQAGGRLRRAFKKLASSSDEIDADELQVESHNQGCRQIQGLSDRERVTVYGHLKKVCVAPRAGTPTLEASLYDGSAVLTLVWLGRRKVAGIRPGVDLTATGRVSCHDGRRVMFNPRYELKP